MYETIIIGGGPAGISAAIYLARYNRKVLVVDKNDGRWNSNEINQNYLGFPDGIPAKELRNIGIQQAKNYGAEFVFDEVKNIKKNDELFILKSDISQYKAKSIIFATGVRDIFPEYEGIRECIGKSLFWCLTCDGYKTIDKNVVIIGDDEEAWTTALQFLNFTKKIKIITDNSKENCNMKKEILSELSENKIEIFHGKIVNIKTKFGYVENIKIDNADEIAADYVFYHKEAIPNIELAKELGIKINNSGYILADTEQRTNIPFVYAAGDVTKNFAHQVITAAHEGSAAAESANWDLYSPEQRGELKY